LGWSVASPTACSRSTGAVVSSNVAQSD
jgi:hypothetical protein